MAIESLSVTYHCADPAATAALAARLAEICEACPRQATLIALSGPLGAGKTHFAAAFGRRWGSETPLTSPTFTLLHEHRRAQDAQRLYHADGYRFETPAAARALGIEELLAGSAILLVEWPEHFGAALPPERLTVTFAESAAGGRAITLNARGAEAGTLLRQLLAQDAEDLDGASR